MVPDVADGNDERGSPILTPVSYGRPDHDNQDQGIVLAAS
jgi:hypothetical protein